MSRTRRDARLQRLAIAAGTGLIALCASAPPSAHAQETELQALRRQIEELQGRLEKLESTQNASAANNEANPPSRAKFPVTISGLAQVQGLSFFGQRGGSPNAQNTFRLRRAEIQVSGAITPRISGTIKVDAAKALGTNTAAASFQAGNILQDLQLTYLVRTRGTGATASNLYIDAGQFKIPVGYESLQSSAALPLVERALMFTARDPFRGGYGDIRDTGLQLRGNFGTELNFRLGAFNGAGERQNAQALSDAKAYLGLLSYTPTGVPGLTVGISGGSGNTGSGGPTGSGTTVDFPERARRTLFNAFGVYKRDKITLQGELLNGKSAAIGVTGGTGANAPLIGRDIRGYYASVGYLFTPQLEGVLRYDTLNADRNAPDGTGDTRVRDLIIGANYYLKGNNAKVQVNLIERNGARGLFSGGRSVGSSTGSSDLSNSRTELRTQLQVSF